MGISLSFYGVYGAQVVVSCSGRHRGHFPCCRATTPLEKRGALAWQENFNYIHNQLIDSNYCDHNPAFYSTLQNPLA